MDWIKNIGKLIQGTIQSARKPVPSIPPILLLCEIMNRPGMSAIALTGAIISKLQQKDIKTGVNDCGMENMNNKFVKIMAEETIKHIKMYGRVDNVVDLMGISFTGVGGNAGGPTVISLYNINNAQYSGIPE